MVPLLWLNLGVEHAGRDLADGVLPSGENVETLVPKDYVENSLRAAGLLGLSPRTYRRACRPPNGLESIFDDLGRLDGRHILAVPRGDPSAVPLIPDGTAISAIRTPPSVMGSNPRALRRPCTVVRQPFGF